MVVHQTVGVVLVRPKGEVDPVLARLVLEANEAEVVAPQIVEVVLVRRKKVVGPGHPVLLHEDLLLRLAPTAGLVP